MSEFLVFIETHHVVNFFFILRFNVLKTLFWLLSEIHHKIYHFFTLLVFQTDGNA